LNQIGGEGEVTGQREEGVDGVREESDNGDEGGDGGGDAAVESSGGLLQAVMVMRLC
jgi:hypothetical protein